MFRLLQLLTGLGLDFLRLRVTNPYIRLLDFLRLADTNPYVWGLDFLSLGDANP